MNGKPSNPPSFEAHTSPLVFSNDGNLQIVKQSNPPNSFVVADDRDQHVELFTQDRKIADAFVAGYDYAERLHREGVEHRANVARIQLLISDAKTTTDYHRNDREGGYIEGLERALRVLEGKG